MSKTANLSSVQVPKDTPFQLIRDAANTTGLSQYYLRAGCKAGTVPHIKSGVRYLINVPALLQQLGVDQRGKGAADA